MDKSLEVITERRILKTVEALKKNNFEAHYIENTEALHDKISEYMFEGCTWSVGGSVTLKETGVIDFLKKGNYSYFDRYAKDADTDDIFAKAKTADVYFTGANAIIEDGILYNVDGNGNRVSAIIHGPKKVVVVAGYNKIVKTLNDAVTRVQEIAAPANAERLNTTDIVGMCCHEVISRMQRVKNRIAVLILLDQYGY